MLNKDYSFPFLFLRSCLGRQNAKNCGDAVFCPSAVGSLCLEHYLHTCAGTISMAIQYERCFHVIGNMCVATDHCEAIQHCAQQ